MKRRFNPVIRRTLCGLREPKIPRLRPLCRFAQFASIVTYLWREEREDREGEIRLQSNLRLRLTRFPLLMRHTLVVSTAPHQAVEINESWNRYGSGFRTSVTGVMGATAVGRTLLGNEEYKYVSNMSRS